MLLRNSESDGHLEFEWNLGYFNIIINTCVELGNKNRQGKSLLVVLCERAQLTGCNSGWHSTHI